MLWRRRQLADRTKLVQLLGQVPRIILLILKTNDLSTSEDCYWWFAYTDLSKLVASMKICILEKDRSAILWSSHVSAAEPSFRNSLKSSVVRAASYGRVISFGFWRRGLPSWGLSSSYLCMSIMSLSGALHAFHPSRPYSAAFLNCIWWTSSGGNIRESMECWYSV